MAIGIFDKRLDANGFYPVLDTLAGMNAKKDLINVKLNEKLTLLDQFVEWIKSFVCDETKLSRNNINLMCVAENVKKFVQNNHKFLKIQAQNAHGSSSHAFTKLVDNIEMLKERFVKKHSKESGIETTAIYQDLGVALTILKKM